MDISGLDELKKANSNYNPGIQTGPLLQSQDHQILHDSISIEAAFGIGRTNMEEVNRVK